MGKMSDERRQASKGGGKLDEFVAKLIPEKHLSVAFVSAAGAAFVFFIFMIIGLARSPTAAAQKAAEEAGKERDEIQETLAGERGKHSETRATLQKADRAKAAAEKERDGAKKNADKLGEQVKAFQTQVADLRKQLDTEKTGRREVDREKTKAERERDAARKEAASLKKKQERTEASLAELRKQHDELRAVKGAQADIAEKARGVFDSIMEQAAQVEAPQDKIDVIERLRAASRKELTGTPYMGRLDDEMERQQKAIETEKRSADRKAVREAKETYEEAMRRLKMASEHEAAMTILREAKADLLGTDYEVRVHKEIEKREKAHTGEVARAIYDAVMKKVKDSPKAYEENLAALKDALAQIKGSRYESKLDRLVESREKTLRENVGRAAYDDVMALIKKGPKEYDENIAAAEAALPKTEGTRYEAPLTKRLASLRSDRLESVGRAAYDKARAQLKSSPRDYAANVTALEALKAEAAGSRWEASINKLLTKQKTLLERSRK